MEKISQKEYLKKYLSIGKDPNRKKKRSKKRAGISDRVKIIDDDLDAATFNQAVEEDLQTNEDAPQIVGVIDDRPMALLLDDFRKSDKWKPLGPTEEFELPEKYRSVKRNDSESIKRESVTQNSQEQLSGDMSPPRRRRRDSDASPPRKRDYDISSRDKRRNDDFSPPRKKKYDDYNPARRHRSTDTYRRNTNSSQKRTSIDVSPVRRSKDKSRSSYQSSTKKMIDGDVSPPRRSKEFDNPRHKSKEDNGRRNKDGDVSPPRRSKEFDNPRHKSKENNGRRNKSRWDSSPQIEHSNISQHSPSHIQLQEIKKEPDTPKTTKMSDGKSAGLRNAEELIRETQIFNKREDEMFKNMSAEISGVNAKPVVRDKKTGKIRDLKKEAEEEKKKKEKENEHKAKYDRWGKGLKQVEAYDEKVKEDLHEMNKPLARYADDEDLEKYLKEQERDGDPMLAYIKKKKRVKEIIEGKPMKPQFEGEFMPNRYGIRPGHRWDGVDRSNGYEKKYFEVLNSRNAQQEEIYKWSTEDM